MEHTTVLFLRAFLFLWIVCVVVYCELEKRDVHRIILQENRPSRSHKRGRHSNNNHHHHHHKHHGHGTKKEKHHSREKDYSYEDDDGSYSRENSFEVLHKHKGRNHHHKSPSHLRNHHFDDSNSEFNNDETKSHSFRETWTPVTQSDDSLRYSYENHRNKHRKPKKESKRRSKFPMHIEFTTAFPQMVPFSSYASTNYPLLDTFSNFNQKIIDTHQSPLIGTIEQFHYDTPSSSMNSKQLVLDKQSKNQNHKTNYEVRENIDEDDPLNGEISFQQLLPLFDVAKAQLEVEETKTVPSQSNVTLVDRKKNARTRIHRGKTKF